MTGRPTERRLARQLLTWYKKNRRPLPWRGTRDPYAITVSEFMLHQTRVQAVVPYYQRFLERFPDWASLAAASLDEVLKAWEGLGYYARARNLHALARRVTEDYDGRLPETEQELLALPGIGRYTAGALLSIWLGRDVPAIDGNARRVICRLFHITDDPTSPKGRKQVLERVRALLPQGQAGAFNQALMDLGSSICTPRKPACHLCLWTGQCRARQLGIQETLPTRKPRKPIPHHDIAAGVIWRNGRILVAKRPLQGLLGGLWEFPGGKREAGESLEECLEREVGEELGVQVRVGKRLATVRHAYTHFRITLHAFRCEYVCGEPHALGCAAWKWVAPSELSDYAFPAANRTIIASLSTESVP